MSDISVENPLVIAGTPDVVYDYVYISNLNIQTLPGEKVSATVLFRYYRILEGGALDYAPLSLGEKMLQINDLNSILGAVEGGSGLKDAVEAAFIGLGKAMGVL